MTLPKTKKVAKVTKRGPARKVVGLLLEELKDRGGFDDFWDTLDQCIQEEITRTLVDILVENASLLAIPVLDEMTALRAQQVQEIAIVRKLPRRLFENIPNVFFSGRDCK